MTTLKNNEYIVFQPDQVLTNVHLNQIFYYLDRQNRMTRIRLIGMGIVCGFELEVTLTANLISSIKIDKGCGITSQGYLISDCEDKEYAYAIPYTPPPLPDDLPFCCKDKTTGQNNIPFYNNPKLQKQNCTGIYKLVTCDQYKTIVEDPNSPVPKAPPCPPATVLPAVPGNDQPGTTDQPLPIPLSSKDWTNYVVVLFLEAKELDLKNCDMQDCNNKGEKIVFHIRPLLVPKTCVTNHCGKNGGDKNEKAPEIKFQRYNVPPVDISNASAILDSFTTITSPSLIKEIAGAYEYCFSKYGAVLRVSGPYPDLATNLNNILNGLVNNRLLTEYFYDYLNDLILAYYEFREQDDTLNFQCCPDECAFPLHLVLGDANKSTNAFIKDCWRTYFIYSQLFDGDRKSLVKAGFYLSRMLLLAGQFPNALFKIPDEVSVNENKAAIKITPSQYEYFPLSQRAIPFYYPELPLTDKSIYHYWNYKKTKKGNEAFNLSYNAHSYNPLDQVVNAPLRYDIEKYNFFRIEGHIGRRYSEVMNSLATSRQKFNLPFDVVALAAEQKSLVLTKIPPCVIKDLLTEYETRVIEFLCKLILCTRKLSHLAYTPVGETKASVKATVTETVAKPDDLNMDSFLKTFQFGTDTYKAGDFIRFSAPEENTVGRVYIDSVKNKQFNNPVDIDKLNCDNLELNKSYSAGFSVLHATDSMFHTFLNTDVSKLVPSAIESQFTNLNKYLSTLKVHTAATPAAGARHSVFSTASFDDCACDCLPCLLLDILWLISQILKRIVAYELEMIFANYFIKHPGLEHKAGVPKGGTFVIVYSDGDLSAADVIEKRTFDRAALEINTKKDPIVIADFYIPYLCCSDCSPVLPSVPPTPVRLTLSVKQDMCSHETAVPINTQPADPNGEVVSTAINDALIKQADGTWILDPSKIDFKDKLKVSDTLVYQSNGHSSTEAPVNIYKYPDSDFNYKGEDTEFTFTPVIPNDSSLTFKWSFYQNAGVGGDDIDITSIFTPNIQEIIPVQYEIHTSVRELDINNAKTGYVGLQVNNGPTNIACRSLTKKQLFPFPQTNNMSTKSLKKDAPDTKSTDTRKKKNRNNEKDSNK